MIKINPYILGDIEPALFIAAMLFAMIGVFIVLLLGTRLREKESVTSPTVFSWKYLFSDNAKRILGSVLCVLVTLRFMPEILNVQLSAWMGFVVGTFWDGLALIIKQKTSLFDPRTKP